MIPASPLPPPQNERTHAHRRGGASLFLEGVAFLVMIAVLLLAGFAQSGGL
jgi:hypothetical protein